MNKKKMVALLILTFLSISALTVLNLNRPTGAQSPEAELTGQTSDSGKDTDADGKYNYLEIAVEINVTVLGNYKIRSTYLVDNVSFLIRDVAVSEAHLDVGLQWLNLSFYGPIIYSSQRNPSRIQNIELDFIEDPYVYKVLDNIYDIPLAGTYSYTQFDPGAALTGTVHDQTIDSDSDWLADELRIGFEVNVFEEGTYMLTVQTLEGSSASMYVYMNSEAFLTAGTHTLNVSVYGPIIFRQFKQSQESVTHVSFSLSLKNNDEFYQLDSKLHIPLNRAYPYNEFESHAYFTGTVSDNGVDTDSDGLFDELEVHVGLNVTEAGDYVIRVSGLLVQYDSFGWSVYGSQNVEAHFTQQVHTVNFTFSGPMIAYYHINPANISSLVLYEQMDIQLDYVDRLALPTTYSWTQFNAPSTEMEIDLTVYPDGKVGLGGKYNSTRMYPPNEGPQLNGTLNVSTNGDLTSGSITGTIAPPAKNEWPFNSTSAGLSSHFANGSFNASLQATTFLPPEAMSQYPMNSSNFMLNSTYSNGVLDVKLKGNTTIPSHQTMFPFNVSDIVVLADYEANELHGNVTFHTISGFPLGDVKLYFDGNRTTVHLTGNLTLIYGTYGDMGEFNETSVEDMLADLNSTIPGQGPDSLYNLTGGTLECTQLNTVKTPVDSVGALIEFDATLSGNLTNSIAKMFAEYSYSYDPDLAYSIISAALDAAVSSVQRGSLVATYYSVSGMASVDMQLACDVKALWNRALQVVPPAVPVENRTMAEAWLTIANLTADTVQEFSLNASYSVAAQRLDLNAWISAFNVTELSDDITPILADAVPSNLNEIVESFTNTTYCTLTSANSEINYVNGTGSFIVTWVLQGDFKACVNSARRLYIDALNATSPWMIEWEHRLINVTEIDINNLSVQFNEGEDNVYVAFQGIMLQPPREVVDPLKFSLHDWLNMTCDSDTPREFEKLKIVVSGGSAGTQTVFPDASDSVPSPNATSLDYRTLMWENATMCSLKNLLFKIAYQATVNYDGHTFQVPILTNSTVSNFSFNATAKSISFNVTGTDGSGYCNITIPNSMLYAALGDWNVRMNGETLSLGNFTITENSDCVFLYLNYTHSTHMIEVVGTWVVPEFSTGLVAFTLTTTAVAAAIVSRQKRKRKHLTSEVAA